MNKRILTIAVVASLAMFGCNQSTGNGQTTSGEPVKSATASANSEEGKVVQMNKAMFLERVFNYEKNPDTWVYEGNKPAIIDFYADWCGPCKKIAPIMAQLAEEYKDQIVIYKVDTDKERELAQVFQIRSIPSILFIPAEGQPQMTMGALPKAEFEKMIKEVLLAPKAQPASQK
ncbi:thioredoxin [Lentimicrobium saccharophilum]|uniref:Thioredoxin n=1 Tax=Lentimicrobium saccharophilum TaxID=1678841 RepID=A0A0S7C0H9_9BACT|nr:thioredoxin [Lentimicrobium saccharophilum]